MPDGSTIERLDARSSRTCAANSRQVRAQRARSAIDKRAQTIRWHSVGSRFQWQGPAVSMLKRTAAKTIA